MTDEPEDERLPLWECGDCGTERRSHALASDDWDGEPVAIGPDCPECDCPMTFVSDPADEVQP